MKKTFDCVEMKHLGSLQIYEEIKGMTIDEQVAYWKKKSDAFKREMLAAKKRAASGAATLRKGSHE